MHTATSVCDLIAAALADVTITDLFQMRTDALMVDSEADAVREDAFTAALFAARAVRDAADYEIEQVRTRASLVLQYMEGTGEGRPMSVSAAETAAGRDPDYLRAKGATAEAQLLATVAAAIARDLAKLAGLPETMPSFGVAAHV